VPVGTAAAIRGGGPIAPAIHDADGRSLDEPMAALRDLVARVRSGGLRSSELSDPTVTALGERGVETVYGVICPPQTVLIGFGRPLRRAAGRASLAPPRAGRPSRAVEKGQRPIVTAADLAGRPAARTILRIFLPFALGYLVSYVFRTVNAVIADDLAAAVGADAASLGLLTSAYFVAFAAFQIPLGLLLDRFGPRRVEAGLLVVAAAGALAFSMADSLAGLTAARALIGLGVSACLMAAFKNAVLWWPRDRLPLVNGLILAFGGLGAVAATTPVAALTEVVDWRGVFRLLAAITLAASAYIWLAVPEPRTGDGRPPRLRDQLVGLGTIYRSAFFWRLAPLTVAIQAGHMAYQGLWAAPWLAEVDGLDRPAVADILRDMGVAMILGYAAVGLFAERLTRIGVRPLSVSIAFAGLFLANALAVCLPLGLSPAVHWPLYVFLATASILGYTVLSQSFPAAMAGRANTALNLLAFAAAFAAQAGLGVVIGLVPGDAGDAGGPGGHRLALGLTIALTAAGWLWAVRPGAPRAPAAGP